ncbi:MAG TPA: AAA family ATPase [Ktedonobacterales bacterium]|jgi:hypothetical protein
MGWREWGRRWGDGSRSSAKPGGATLRALTARDELVRTADWPRLPEERRQALRAPYAALALPTAAPAGRALDDDRDRQSQQWLAGLVAPHLQAKPVATIQMWLDGAAHDTHLAANGPAGRGRHSVVLTLARRAMATQPAPPDYCYAPDPRALSHTVLLALPTGLGVRFAESLNAALRQIVNRWEKPHERGHAETDDPGDPQAARLEIVKRVLEPLGTGGLAITRPYVRQLTEVVAARTGESVAPEFAEADAPAGRPTTPPADAAEPGSAAVPADGGAPVIVASPLRGGELTRALLRANGGVLILSATDLVEREQTTAEWSTLRSALRSGSLALRGVGEPAVPLALRVALIGAYTPLSVLERADDFGRLFRYRAKFDYQTPWTPEAEAIYATLADAVTHRYSLPALDAGAVGRLVEEAARRSQDRHRAYLTTDLLMPRDLMLEAARIARDRAAASKAPPATARATAEDVEAALDARRAQQGETARLAREAILQDRERVPTSGAAVGQITGLSVLNYTPHEARFGTPFRLSVTVSPGQERLIDIERESRAADETHIAGALTMAGFLAWRYGRHRAINVVARTRFEQLDNETVGPSASAAELLALLSALAEAPIRAALAVTGAVSQQGEMQLVGGINAKIEGFWEICHARQAQGEAPAGGYGIVIPAANAGDIMLRADIADDIASGGWFHIWPVATVDEALPLLTGLSASAIHARVARTLRRFTELVERQVAG